MNVIRFQKKAVKNYSKLNTLLVFLLLIFLSACATKTKKTASLLEYIPQEAQVILKINNLEQTKNILRDNKFLKDNTKNSFFDYFEQLPVLHAINQPQGLLCFSPVGKNDYEYTYIAKIDPGILSQDSLRTKTIETIKYATNTIFKISEKGDTYFAAQQDSILITSSSELLIENVIRQQEKKTILSEDLQKAYEISDNTTAVSVLIDGKKFKTLADALLPKSSLPGIANFSGWTSTDATIDQNAFYLDGIAIEKDSLSSTIGIFDNTLPQENRISEVAPATARGFISYTYDDFNALKKNLALAQDRDVIDMPDTLDEFLSGASEFGIIYLEKENVVTVTSLDAINATTLLDGTPSGSYREMKLYKFEHPGAFSQILSPLLPDVKANFFMKYEDHFIFSATKAGLQTVIANIVNKTVLETQQYYSNTSEKLSDAASILLVSATTNLKNYITTSVAEDIQKPWEALKIDGYPVAALQVIKEQNFAHLHGVFQKSVARGSATSVNQVASTTLDTKMLNKPQLVYNHRTKGKDIVVQDIENNLYLISDKGTIFWKKQIDGAIMGDIQQIDIYKNGRYQLLFNTANAVYLLDRNGKEVAPYPIQFDQKITQPLALFDYDKNKRYRIMITQGNEVTMLDAKGKKVTGFGYSKTKTPLIKPPQHIRIGSKDYILLSEESGKFTILDRLGRDRIKVKENINFSDNPWYQYQNKFTSIAKDGKLIQVASDGSILLTDKELKENAQLAATNKTLVTFSENKLTIKDKTIELDFGVYSSPQLFYINNKIYVTITDIQAHKVYLYDSNGILFPNFPVYGNSAISLGNMDKDPNLEFVVQGEENGILMYQIN